MFKKLIIYIVGFMFSIANAVDFKEIKFEQENLSIEIPQDWSVVKKETLDSFKKVSGNKNHRTILGVNSSQYNHKAQIRLSIYNLTITEEMLDAITTDDLNYVKEMFDQQNRLLQQKTGQFFSENKISTFKLNSKISLLDSYVRKGRNNSLWNVDQYMFPDSKNNREIRLTLSYNISEKEKYKVTLNNILNSLKF